METRREIIFDMPSYKGNDYRVLCRFGYDSFINFAWWGFVQKKVTFKKWGFFGPTIEKWIELDKCWWSKEINNREDLEKISHDFYDETVLRHDRIVERAMSI